MIPRHWAMAGTATALIGGAAAWYFLERSTQQPVYRMRRSEEEFELRDYDPMLVASATREGPREEALEFGFERLAAYIFARERGDGGYGSPDGERIAMTAPVFQDEAGGIGSGLWRTRFVMPARYTRASLPAPPADVLIEDMPARRLAAVRFSGKADDDALLYHEDELRRWLELKHLQPIGDFEYAFYNSPFVPSFLRRSEVLVPVAQ